MNSTGWPLICTPEYIATRPPRYNQSEWSQCPPARRAPDNEVRRFDNAERHRNGKHNRWPLIDPRINPEYSHAATSPPASLWRGRSRPYRTPAVFRRTSMVSAEHFVNRNNYRPENVSQSGASAVIPTIARPSAPIAIKLLRTDRLILRYFYRTYRGNDRTAELRQDPVYGSYQHKEHLMYMMISLIPIAFTPC